MSPDGASAPGLPRARGLGAGALPGTRGSNAGMMVAGGHQGEANQRVLVIDDCADIHELLRARLSSEGVEVVGISDGATGVREVARLQPALVLLDIQMPGMDGFEVLRALREDPRSQEIPVIMLAAEDNAPDKVEALELGALDFIFKPFDMPELRARVRSALRLSSLMRMLAQRAQIDGLTGLWNRTYFDERWSSETERSRRHDRPLSLAVLDLDHFKSINDTHGHPAGDAVLQGVARLFTRELRATDVACRYGGEEFALVLPDTTPEDARVLCERIRETLEATVWGRHPSRPVTISCGIAGTNAAITMDEDEWLEIADRALYTSKREGRNRVTVTDLTPDGTALRVAS